LSRAKQNSLTPTEVFSLVEGEIAEELEPCGDEAIDRELAIAAAQLAGSVAKARDLYQQHGDEAIPLMIQSPDENVRNIGGALASGWYADLAI